MVKPVLDQFYPGGPAQQAIDWNDAQHQAITQGNVNSNPVPKPGQIGEFITGGFQSGGSASGQIISPVNVLLTMGWWDVFGVCGFYQDANVIPTEVVAVLTPNQGDLSGPNNYSGGVGRVVTFVKGVTLTQLMQLQLIQFYTGGGFIYLNIRATFSGGNVNPSIWSICARRVG